MDGENNTPKNEWRLKEIEIRFERGFNHREKEEERHDRYVGKIAFENGEGESFNLKIPESMTMDYLDLMRQDIVNTAESLGAKIAESIRLTKPNTPNPEN